MRALLNRWRRRVWQALFYRMVFGEQDGMGRPLAHTRIAPSTCIEGAAGLQLADLVVSPIGRHVLGKSDKEDWRIVKGKFRTNRFGKIDGFGLVILPR